MDFSTMAQQGVDLKPAIWETSALCKMQRALLCIRSTHGFLLNWI